MKQTDQYQFNLVEAGDTFSPDPLNENMEKVEAAFTGTKTMVAQLAAEIMTAVGRGGHTARISFGSYVGTGSHGAGSPNFLTFDFKPLLVCAGSTASPQAHLFFYAKSSCEPIGGLTHTSFPTTSVTWGDDGISWYHSGGALYQLNEEDTTYHWVAVGYDAG